MNGTACDADGTVCTTGDTCKSGKCVAGAGIKCDDGNGCTTDACDPSKGCSHVPVGVACDADGSACTKNDICKGGTCTAGPAVQCDDKNPCTDDSCAPATGACKHAGDAQTGSPCDADGSVCTVADACKGGGCVPGAKKSCDDNNPCTDDSCNAKTGCVYKDNTKPCDSDGKPCTVGDACKSGGCLPGKAKKCDDGSVCTVDSCVAATGICKFDGTPQQGKACDADGSTCTVGDKCVSGKCTAGPGKVCNDGNVCTKDTCDGVKGCAFTPITAPCNADSSLCSHKDSCKAGKCVPGPLLKCTDGKVCTDDGCDPGKGCVFDLNKAPCDADGNVCTVGDVCKAGTCKPGLTKTCSDGNVCTTDSCHKTKSCVFAPVKDGIKCTNGACSKGKCVVNLGTQANPATGCWHLLKVRTDLKNKNGAYWIDPDGAGKGAAAYRVWCDMTSSGGGWTLLMKTNGYLAALNYDSAYWVNTALIAPTSLSMTPGNAKFYSFINLPFTELRLGMQRGSTKRWTQFKYTYSSLRKLMTAGFKSIPVSRNTWKSLIGSDASLQKNCNRSGFNNYHAYTRVRIGIIANQENDCNTPDSRLGFGARGAVCAQDNNNTTGNTAACSPDNGNKNIKAYGFIFAR